MSDIARQRILVVSEAYNWRASMSIAFEAAGAAAADVDGAHSVARAGGFVPTAVVIDVDGEMALPRVSDRFEAARHTGRALRAHAATLPIVFMTSIPMDELNALARELGSASVALALCLDCEKLAAQLLDAIVRLAPAVPAPPGTLEIALVGAAIDATKAPPPFATVEITIAQASLHCDVRAGGSTTTWGPSHWKARNTMAIINREFRNYESSDEQFKKLGLNNMEDTGERLLLEHFDEPLSFAYEFCKAHVPADTPIFHRFVLEDGDLEFVPFEIISTRNRLEYLRFVYPVARRLLPKQEHVDANRLRSTGRPRQRVLFIVSNVAGFFEVPGLEFKTERRPSLRKLAHLESELAAVQGLYGDRLVPLVLKAGQDNVARIRAALQEARFDIVHFAGHSLRADDEGQVFLALPGDNQLRAVPYDAEDFARLASANDVSLVVLSSCEGSSGLALSRMASRGIPAVAGFRWPVDDEDASYFTAQFHRELCADGHDVPICTAFHRALLRLKEHCPQRLTGFSPVLMLQRAAWHDFSLEN